LGEKLGSEFDPYLTFKPEALGLSNFACEKSLDMIMLSQTGGGLTFFLSFLFIITNSDINVVFFSCLN